MNIAVIGAGNMGAAIAHGIARLEGKDICLTVSNRSDDKLQKLKEEFPSINVTTDNRQAVTNADMLILAVKPYVAQDIADELKNLQLPQTIVSVVAGLDTSGLSRMFGTDKAYFCVIPNTAASVGKSMTFIACDTDNQESISLVKDIFSSLGEVAVVPERLLPAGTALCSCGIAFVFKYIQACVQAGVQLGFTPRDALRYTCATIDGAVRILTAEGTSPQAEIDRVTTPGGMTIKGVNNLEFNGFTASVISAVLKTLEK